MGHLDSDFGKTAFCCSAAASWNILQQNLKLNTVVTVGQFQTAIHNNLAFKCKNFFCIAYLHLIMSMCELLLDSISIFLAQTHTGKQKQRQSSVCCAFQGLRSTFSLKFHHLLPVESMKCPPHHHRTPSACRGRPQDANAAINRRGPTDGLAPSGDRRDYSCRGRREHPAPSSVRIPDGKSRPQSSGGGGGGGGSGGGGGGGADRGVTSPSRSLSYLVVSPLTFPTATRAVQGHQ